MSDLPMYNVGRPRRSFLDEPYNMDERMAQWAQETGRMNPVEREGSVFMEDVEPITGEKKYIARRKSKVEMGLGTATYSDGVKKKTARVMNAADKPEDGFQPFVTEDKTYQPVLTNRKALSFLPKFEEDMRRKEMESERERRMQERIAEEARADERRDALEAKRQEREFGGMERMLAIQEKARQASPDYAIEQKLREGKLTEIGSAAEERNRLQKRKASFLDPNADIPGISRTGEKITRDQLNAGADIRDAEQMGRRAHDLEANSIRQWEESGDPDLIAKAKKLRDSDPDLASVPSGIDPARQAQFGAQKQAIVGSELKSFLDDLARKADAEDISPDFWNKGEMDPYADFDPDVKRQIASNVENTIQRIRANYATITPQELQATIQQKMQSQGFPQDYIAEILSLVR